MQLLSANVDTHAVELDIVGDKLLRCQTGGADWNTAVVNAGVEDGESQEATDAYAAKRVLFDKHSAILRILHDITKMTLGADSQKFKDLGIVPSSEIWTPGQPEPGEPEASGIFHYRATPYNAAMEPGIASEDTVEVT